jgi:hypothetical protein
MKLPANLTKIDAWLTAQGFEPKWAIDKDDDFSEPVVIAEMHVPPAEAMARTTALYEALQRDHFIRTASSAEFDCGVEDGKLLPSLHFAYTPGDDFAQIILMCVDDKTLRNAIMRLAS